MQLRGHFKICLTLGRPKYLLKKITMVQFRPIRAKEKSYMFTNIYQSLQEGFQQSWFKGLFENAALAKLFAQIEEPSAWGFFSTYLSSWWWNRLRFRSCIQTKDTLVQFDAIIETLQILKRAGIFTEGNCNVVTTHHFTSNLSRALSTRALSNLQEAGILNQENFVLVAAHARPANLGSALSKLQRARILNPENFVLVAAHARPANLAYAFSNLQEAGILNQENFVLVAAHAAPDHLASALSDLWEARILNPENFALVAAHARPANLGSALSKLQRSRILNQENIALVAAHAAPSDLADALSDLERAGISTQENFVLIAAHASPANLAYLANLQRAGLSTAENIVMVTGYDFPIDLPMALSYLLGAGISTQENLMLVAAHASPAKLARALSYLQLAGILNPENIALVAAQDDPSKLAYAFSNLREVGILNQENIALVAAHAAPDHLASALFCLLEARILNQENFAALVTPNHAALMTNEAYEIIWRRIPSHLLTTDNFRSLLTAAERVNPIAELERLSDHILGVQVGIEHVVNFNPEQSTHTASVHKSISASAVQLMHRYGSSLSLETKILEIKDFVQGLADTPKHQAAKRCIERITAVGYTFTDTSQVSTRQLLALSYTAIHDEAKRLCPLEDAKALFVEGLYEIQRGYNLNPDGSDKGGDDLPICTPGTFNKLMEKLNGIHPDVKIDYINHEGAYNKFPKLVKDHALKYLTQLDPKQASTLLDEIRTSDNLMPIWGAIEPTVKTALWDEFKEAYGSNQADKRFTDLFDTVEYLDCAEIVKEASESLPTNACASQLGLFAATAASAVHQVPGSTP